MEGTKMYKNIFGNTAFLLASLVFLLILGMIVGVPLKIRMKILIIFHLHYLIMIGLFQISWLPQQQQKLFPSRVILIDVWNTHWETSEMLDDLIDKQTGQAFLFPWSFWFHHVWYEKISI